MFHNSQKSNLVRLALIFVLIMGVLAVMPVFASQSVVYVKADATGSNNGSSWQNAFTDLQLALVPASAGTEIWVAAGTYKPGTDRNATFVLQDGVALYGGFRGDEFTRAQRDPLTNLTILSGDLNGDDNANVFPDEPTRAENVYHVISSSGLGNTTILDGFTIKGGNANGIPREHTARGGGMWNSFASPMLRNIIFTANDSLEIGGGMYTENGSSPLLYQVTFYNNFSEGGGGLASYQSSPNLLSVSFRSNTASFSGGGMLNVARSSPVLQDVTFEGNFASTFGGGMSSIDSALNVYKTTFSYNFAAGQYNAAHEQGRTPPYGGGMYNFTSSGTVVNSTFTGNRAGGGDFPFNGTGIGNRQSDLSFTQITLYEARDGIMNDGSFPVIRNSILWGISSSLNGFTAINDTNISNSTVSDSVIDGGFQSGNNIITADPNLDMLMDNGGATKTLAIWEGSSALDRADINFCPPTDQRGVSRPQGNSCDIGAYEYTFPITPTAYFTITPTLTPTITPTSTPVMFTISGNAGVGGATLTYVEDGVTKSVNSDVDGNYTLTVKGGWFGTVTPYRMGTTFTPASRSYNNVHANQTAQNYSAVVKVINTNDSGPGSLRQAVADVLSGTTITFDPALAGQTITLASTIISPDKSLSIDGSSLSPRVEISGNNTVSIFYLGGFGESVALQSLVLKNGSSSDTVRGGGALVIGSSQTTIRNVYFVNNSAHSGGAIYSDFYNVNVQITECTFAANFAQSFGGAIDMERGTLKVENSYFGNNSSAVVGGAISLSSDNNYLVQNNTFVGNSALSGGAMYLTSLNNDVYVRNNTFSNNQATNIGGAIFESMSYTGHLVLENNTLYMNQAARGGGVFTSDAVLKNNTFSHNKATQDSSTSGGNLYLWAPMDVKLYNNILANHTGGGDCYRAGDGVVLFTAKNNLIEDGSSVCQPAFTGDPLLDVLSNNGGSTNTMALLPGSPAIDAGDDGTCLATDQRGVTRPQGSHCDLGAYEYGLVPPTVTPTFTPIYTPTYTPTSSPTMDTVTPTKKGNKPPTSTPGPVTPTKTPTPIPPTKTLVPTKTPRR